MDPHLHHEWIRTCTADRAKHRAQSHDARSIIKQDEAGRPSTSHFRGVMPFRKARLTAMITADDEICTTTQGFPAIVDDSLDCLEGGIPPHWGRHPVVDLLRVPLTGGTPGTFFSCLPTSPVEGITGGAVALAARLRDAVLQNGEQGGQKAHQEGSSKGRNGGATPARDTLRRRVSSPGSSTGGGGWAARRSNSHNVGMNSSLANASPAHSEAQYAMDGETRSRLETHSRPLRDLFFFGSRSIHASLGASIKFAEFH